MRDMSKFLALLPILVLAIGLIGWVLTLRNDVSSTSDQINDLHEEIVEIYERIDELVEVQIELERSLAIADDQMKTIMGDHEGFNDVLQDLGAAGLLPSGERRAYGGYSK